jgi:hypothetical protein
MPVTDKGYGIGHDKQILFESSEHAFIHSRVAAVRVFGRVGTSTSFLTVKFIQIVHDPEPCVNTVDPLIS